MIFEENNKEYFLQTSPLSSPEELRKGLWLVMAGIDSIPPHIALISEGKYFSVSAKKVEVAAPIENFLKAISRKTVPTLFINIHEKSPLKGRFRGAGEAFSYPTLGNGPHSCLWPVRDFFAQTFSENFSKTEFVFELLAMAKKDNLILECKSLFIPSGSNNPILTQGEGRVRLMKYTKDQIREKINSILKVNE